MIILFFILNSLYSQYSLYDAYLEAKTQRIEYENKEESKEIKQKSAMYIYDNIQGEPEFSISALISLVEESFWIDEYKIFLIIKHKSDKKEIVNKCVAKLICGFVINNICAAGWDDYKRWDELIRSVRYTCENKDMVQPYQILKEYEERNYYIPKTR